MMNGIFHYSESGKWTKPFAAHDLGTILLPTARSTERYAGGREWKHADSYSCHCCRRSNADYAAKHWEVLTTWTDYLVEKGLDPENQLCTDDFAGHFAHNTNLSIKAILGVASYGRLAEMLGKKDVAEAYTTKARQMATEWERMANDGRPLSPDFRQARVHGARSTTWFGTDCSDWTSSTAKLQKWRYLIICQAEYLWSAPRQS